jgi:hypothetical protein
LVSQLTQLVLARSAVEGGGPSLSITDAGVQQLLRLQRLRILSLAGNWAISDRGVGALCASLTRLRSLDLRRPPTAVPGLPPSTTLTDASLHHIASLKLLEKLRLSEAQVSLLYTWADFVSLYAREDTASGQRVSSRGRERGIGRDREGQSKKGRGRRGRAQQNMKGGRCMVMA